MLRWATLKSARLADFAPQRRYYAICLAAKTAVGAPRRGLP
jgi:hypothetical protein